MESADSQSVVPEISQQPLENQPNAEPQKGKQQKQQKPKQQKQKQQQNQKKGQTVAQPKQPKEIVAKMKEQDKFYESTLKALSSVSLAQDDDEDDWGSSGDDSDDFFSEEAIEKRRMEELAGSSVLQNITALSNEQKITNQIQSIIASSKSTSEKIQEIRKLKSSEKMGDKILSTVLFETFFTPASLLTQLKTVAPMLSALCSSMQSQRCILGNIEKMVISNESTMLKKMNDILFGFYENEILSEEALVDWLDVPDPSFVTIDQLNLIHENSMTFMNWLHQEDDEEDGDEEDDEDDDE